MSKMEKTVLPRLPEASFEPLAKARLEQMIAQAVVMPQDLPEAEIIVFRRPSVMWGGIGALAASVVLAVALTPSKATVVGSASEVDDFSYMLVMDSLDS